MRPPNSPDLNLVDYAVWGALQEMVYHRKTFTSVQELKRAIVTATGSNCHKRFLAEVSVNGGLGGVALKTWYSVMVDTSSMFVELKSTSSTTLVLWT